MFLLKKERYNKIEGIINETVGCQVEEVLFGNVNTGIVNIFY
jgi:hypothetical protein